MTKIIKIEIPEGTRPAICKSGLCAREIFFVKMASGKQCPVDADGTPHHATCPDSKEFKAAAEAKRAYEKRVAQIREENKK